MRGVLLGSLLVLGCSASGGDSEPRDGASADRGWETSDAGTADAGADASAAPPSCLDYCTAIQAACTMGNQQYADMDNCMNSCVAFPVGAGADTSGDTLGCRTHYAREAAMNADLANAHCTHAGPGGYGVCGDACSGYCDIAMGYCTEAHSAQVYDTRDACLADCAMRATDVALCSATPGTTDHGNEVACLLYHVQEATSCPEEHCLGDLAITASSCRSP